MASPLLANVYLHYLFDLWADVWRRKAAKGDVIVVPYADDLVMGFQHTLAACDRTTCQHEHNTLNPSDMTADHRVVSSHRDFEN